MFAPGMVSFTLFFGGIMSDAGATPKVHCKPAPLQTQVGMAIPPVFEK
jgi:hypothetical protein